MFCPLFMACPLFGMSHVGRFHCNMNIVVCRMTWWKKKETNISNVDVLDCHLVGNYTRLIWLIKETLIERYTMIYNVSWIELVLMQKGVSLLLSNFKLLFIITMGSPGENASQIQSWEEMKYLATCHFQQRKSQ